MDNKITENGTFTDDPSLDAQFLTASLSPEEQSARADRIAQLMTSDEMAKRIVRELDDKLAHQIRLLHVEDQTILADYFVIATGNSNTQLRALCGHIEDKLKEAGAEPLHIEGYSEGSWILMDYAGVIVHLFVPETRQFYNLDKLWASSTEVDISDIITSD